MAKNLTKFKIEVSGQVVGSAEEKLLTLVRLMRSQGRDMGVNIVYPALISLDDLPPIEETKR